MILQKETSLFKAGAIENDIERASSTATYYVREVTNDGVFIHEKDGSDDPTEGSGIHISNAISIIRNGLSYIWIGVINLAAKVRIGLANMGHIILGASGMEVYKGSAKVAEFGSDVKVYDSESGDAILEFDDDTGYMMTRSGYLVRNTSTNSGSLITSDGVYSQGVDKTYASLSSDGVKGFNIKTGRIQNVSVPSNSYRDYTASFSGGQIIGNTPFKHAPVVVASFISDSGAGDFGRCTLSVHSATTTSAKIRVFNGGSATRTPDIYWIAMDM